MKAKSTNNQIIANEQLVIRCESNGDALKIECINPDINESNMENVNVKSFLFRQVQENTGNIQEKIQKSLENEMQIYADIRNEIYHVSIIETEIIAEFSCKEIQQTHRKYNFQDAQFRLTKYQKRFNENNDEKQKIINEITAKINGIHSCIEWRIKNLTERRFHDPNNTEIKFRLQEIQEMNKELQLQRI